MLKKTITFEDYNGEKVTQDYYFNLNKAELMEMNFSETGGLANTLIALTQTNDNKKVFALFKNMILRSYGEKSLDGRRFVKSQELRDSFEQSEAYSELIVDMFQNPEHVTEFMLGIIPADMAREVQKRDIAKIQEAVENGTPVNEAVQMISQ